MPSTSEIGYCTNVHAGPTLAETKANLERYALAVKQAVCPSQPMGVGLWLSAEAASQLVSSGEAPRFAAWLAEVGLVPYTFNGFPYGDFHQAAVKHRVYEPTWWQPERLQYTLNLIQLIDALLPPGMNGSISTLPIAWSSPMPTGNQRSAAGANLRAAARAMKRLHDETGRKIVLAIEPEPGCVLQSSHDLYCLFRDWLWRSEDEEAVRTHLGVCHDVCHAAVMFEGQTECIDRYAVKGIEIGKVQVSSAVSVDFDVLPPTERKAALEQLAGFHEPRYLHQTCIRHRGAEPVFYEDLPQALATVTDQNPSGEWRIHFHVPVYLERFGHLSATQQDIHECLKALEERAYSPHFEVETYAWGVLPEHLRVPNLSDGIAREMTWFYGQILE